MYDFGQVSASLNYTGKSQNYTVINGYGALFAVILMPTEP